MQIIFDVVAGVWLLGLNIAMLSHQNDENARFDRLNGRVDLEQIERGKFRREATYKIHRLRCRLFRMEGRASQSNKQS